MVEQQEVHGAVHHEQREPEGQEPQADEAGRDGGRRRHGEEGRYARAWGGSERTATVSLGCSLSLYLHHRRMHRGMRLLLGLFLSEGRTVELAGSLTSVSILAVFLHGWANWELPPQIINGSIDSDAEKSVVLTLFGLCNVRRQTV